MEDPRTNVGRGRHDRTRRQPGHVSSRSTRRTKKLDALVATGDPFAPGWGPGLVEMVLRDDGATDWDEVRELVTESYCLLAPKKLVDETVETRPDP